MDSTTFHFEWIAVYEQQRRKTSIRIPAVPPNLSNPILNILVSTKSESTAEWVDGNPHLSSFDLAQRFFAPHDPVPVVFRGEAKGMFHRVAIRQRPVIFSTGIATSVVRSKLKIVPHQGVGFIRPLIESGQVVLFFNSSDEREVGWRVELDLAPIADQISSSRPLYVHTNVDGTYQIGSIAVLEVTYEELGRLVDSDKLPDPKILLSGSAAPCPYFTFNNELRNMTLSYPDVRFDDERQA